MTEHTPGPWRVIKERGKWEERVWFIGNDSASQIIAEGIYNEADAQLTAASPEMLAAAEELLRVEDWGEYHTARLRAISDLKKAVAKARRRDD